MHGKVTGFSLATADGRPPHLAIVDANTTSAVVMTALVEQFGCTWEIARSGRAAVELLRQNPSIDIVMLDPSVLHADGISALEQPGGARARAIIVVDDGQAVTGVSTAAARVTKPFSPRDVHAALRSALAGDAMIGTRDVRPASLANVAAPQSA